MAANASRSSATLRQPPQWPNWRKWLTYAIPLLVLSWAPFGGLDEVVVALAGLAIGLTHWFFRPATTTVFLLGTGQIVSFANAEKLRDTGDAILWQDILYVLPNISDNLGTLWQYIGFGGLAGGTLALLLLLIMGGIEKRYVQRSLPIGAGFSAVLMLFYLPTTINYSGDVSAAMQQFRQSAKSFAGWPGAPSLARFLHSTTLPPAEFKAGSGDPTLFREQSAKLAAGANRVQAKSPPDIFVILNESQFSPRQLAACTNRADCSMSLFADSSFGALRGPLKVHTHGWGTWNAEFTLMTGVPYFWFGESGFYSAYTTAPRIQMALAQHLASLGYRTIGIYPTQKGMLNSALAYRHYGIQEFYGAEDLDLPLDWCQVPDQMMYEKLLSKYRSVRKEDSRPIFMTMLTIFNHGPHGGGCMDSKLANSLGDNSTPQIAKLEDYLHRSIATDNASAVFRDAILSQPQPILLLFAGDHQPSFEGLASSYPRKMHRQMPAADTLFFTNYQFFTNREGPSSIRAKEKLRELDISFLASSLLEMAMLPLGPLFESNLHLRELCDGRLDSCSTVIVESYKAHLDQVGFYK